jgi:hypothetical protein
VLRIQYFRSCSQFLDMSEDSDNQRKRKYWPLNGFAGTAADPDPSLAMMPIYFV